MGCCLRLCLYWNCLLRLEPSFSVALPLCRCQKIDNLPVPTTTQWPSREVQENANHQAPTIHPSYIREIHWDWDPSFGCYPMRATTKWPGWQGPRRLVWICHGLWQGRSCLIPFLRGCQMSAQTLPKKKNGSESAAFICICYRVFFEWNAERISATLQGSSRWGRSLPKVENSVYAFVNCLPSVATPADEVASRTHKRYFLEGVELTEYWVLATMSSSLMRRKSK